jgi:hypothetical protein
VNYDDHVEAMRVHRPDLADELAHFSGVSSVLAWMQARGLARTTVDIVGQDEFEYDFVIWLGSDREWLSFGLT